MMDETQTLLTPLIFSNIQGSYVERFTDMFSLINHEAIQLFYVLAALEIAFLGILWTLKQQDMMSSFLLKIIKLGMVFFIISHYQTLLGLLLQGFVGAGGTDSGHAAASFIFNPNKIIGLGFDSSISLLQLAVQYGTTNIGISAIYLILGFGLLLMLALIATQVLILILGFYVLALLALLLLPFSTLSFTQNLSYRALQSVIQAGARIFAFVLVLGIGLGIIANLHAAPFTTSTTIDKPLGLFFATFIVTLLSFILPAYAGRAVGGFSESLWKTEASPPFVPTAPSPIVKVSPLTQIASASLVPSTLQPATQLITPTSTRSASNTTVHTGSPTGSLDQKVQDLTQAIHVQRQEGISRDTLNKLKKTFKEMAEH